MSMLRMIVDDMAHAQRQMARLTWLERSSRHSPRWQVPWRAELAHTRAIQSRELSRCGAMLLSNFSPANDEHFGGPSAA